METNRANNLIALEDKFGAHNYHPLPVVLAKGEGVFVWVVEVEMFNGEKIKKTGDVTLLR
jgi:acetylornithine/succinyldiaminopimelate/putrescine aminotransferase